MNPDIKKLITIMLNKNPDRRPGIS
jgi:hypothetical protein